MQSGAVIIIPSFSFVVFCLLFLFACVVLQHYVVNKDEYIMMMMMMMIRSTHSANGWLDVRVGRHLAMFYIHEPGEPSQ